MTLGVIRRRADGYHDIESLVVFAAVGDTLTFTRGRKLSLVVRGPTAAASGEITDNLVLKAVRQMSERIEGLKLGRFVLSKRLPVAAGGGGGPGPAPAGRAGGGGGGGRLGRCRRGIAAAGAGEPHRAR